MTILPKPYNMRQFKTKSKLIYAILLLISLFIIHYYRNQRQKFNNKMSKYDQIIDPYQQLHIIPNPDGSITRLQEFFPAISPSIDTSPALSKDVPLNPSNKTWVRIFLPRTAIDSSNPIANKLPIVVFVHGGGFILYSAASPVFHNFCSELASQLGVLVVAVEYRLAPESRLPAGYDDVLEALLWVKDGKDEWVKKYGNFSRCVMMGQSAGANIVYYAALKALDQVNDLRPLTITDLVLIQPFFGGLNRTGSELRLVNDPYLPLVGNDLVWSLALPVGADRGHEFCNPITHGGSEKLGQVRDLGWRVMVVGCDGDPLLDRQVGLVKMLEEKGVIVKSMFSEGGHHGVFASDSSKRKMLFGVLEESLGNM
ncbi:carboxylesterase 1-like [Chenopodium quinoa]|uniref:carboxylesterase 1-like n=1 Tax=Chenopodium quinoa TaxID=63459 RepID=UPI000B78D1C9|nr:carboxylesterase 1-like [Chenopodium quinoa]